MLKRTCFTVLIVALLGFAASKSAKALDCLFWFPNYTGNGSPVCVWYQLELLPIPGARWCGTQTQPGPREVMMWVDVNYSINAYCMVIPVAHHKSHGGTKMYDLSPWGWDDPYWKISSFWFGSEAKGFVYSEADWEGTITYVPSGSAWPDVRSMSISSFGLSY